MPKETEFLSGFMNIVTFTDVGAYNGVSANDFFSRYNDKNEFTYHSLQNAFKAQNPAVFKETSEGYPFRGGKGGELKFTKDIAELLVAYGVDAEKVNAFKNPPAKAAQQDKVNTPAALEGVVSAASIKSAEIAVRV